jgi:iron complex outermembrane receptor protein
MRTLIMVLLCWGQLNAQYTISGKVTNQNGEQLFSASVFLKGSNYAAVTDADGNFWISNINGGNYVLKASYLGYDDFIKEIEIKDDLIIDIQLAGTKYDLENIEITANRLDTESAFSYTSLQKEEVDIKNLAQDLPILLEHNTSMVVTSDAGAGVGYTGMRIRGSDATRINVTINGVPLNDSESHGVFWVNLPDFSSSVQSVQLQRGVGPSTNGAVAFGATVDLNTNEIEQNALIKLNASYGSFNTRRLSFSATTGLINEQYYLEGRYSQINSDGYVDRASSDLTSYYFSMGKIGEKTSLRFNTFSGSEKTYQAWWGVPEARLTGDQEALQRHYQNNLGSIYQTTQDSINLFSSDRRYNYYLYDNQVDDYRQDHYQFIWGQNLSNTIDFNLTAHYTRGRGFFEEFRTDDEFSFYGLSFVDEEGMSITSSDLVRRRWLDNHFFGAIFNSNIQWTDNFEILFGASGNRYLGDHFGNVIFAEEVQIEDPEFRYYENDAIKDDVNSYLKFNYKPVEKLNLFADLQIRNINYETAGTDNGMLDIDIDTSYTFFNPKMGISYLLKPGTTAYLSLAKAQREPVRSDFIDAVGTRVPSHESLWDLEAGYRQTHENWSFAANVYYMLYDNQLVLTGAVNDVGAPVRTNVDDSYRLGLELEGTWRLNSTLDWSANLTLSRNRISSFQEVIIDFGTGEEVLTDHENTDIAFSPSVIAASNLNYRIKDNLELHLLSKYVGEQFLDNASNNSKKINDYLINDLIFSYRPQLEGFELVELKLLINNIFNTRYSANGYTYSYIFGNLIEENFFYPQAGTNFLLGATVHF